MNDELLKALNGLGDKAVNVINSKTSKIKLPEVKTKVGLEPGVIALAVLALIFVFKN